MKKNLLTLFFNALTVESILIFCMLIFCSCQSKSDLTHNLIKEVKPLKVSDQMRDSTFFMSVTGLTPINNSVYGLDSKANRILEFDSDLNLISSFGSFGKGPGELNNPVSIYTFDQKLIISDLTGILKKFNFDGTFIEQIDLPYLMHGYRIAGNGEIVIYTGYGTKGPLIFFDLLKKSYTESGKFDQTENGTVSRLLSAKIIQIDEAKLLAISVNSPEIGVYNLDGEFLYDLQIPQISPIQKRLKYANNLYQENKNNPNIMVSYISDAVLKNHILYLLLNDQISEDRASCDIVAILSIKETKIHVNKILRLSPTDERGWYNTICVDDHNTFLWAYNEINHSLEKYSLK